MAVYYGLGLDDSWDNVITMLYYSVVLNFAMCAQGYMIGCMTDDHETANSTNGFFIMIFMLVSGGIGNITAFPLPI